MPSAEDASGSERLNLSSELSDPGPTEPSDEAARDQLSLFGPDDLGSGDLEKLSALADSVPLRHEIIEAPTSIQRLPRIFRKANAAVSMYPVKGRYSLVMRKAFNALLALGHARLKLMPADTVEQLVDNDKVLRFEASVTDIKEMMSWPRSGNNDAIYEALDALQKLQAVWDVPDIEGRLWNERASLLSQWGRTEEGLVRWLWVPDLFGLLFHPDHPYTPLDIELTKMFASGYTLALFENVYRFRKMGHTPWRSPQDWRLLIAGSDRYDQLREFKRTVLGTAIKEIRETALCPFEVGIEEKRGLFNRIESMRFKVIPKRQAGLSLDMPVPDNPQLENRLRRMGLTAEKARQFMREYDEAYLLDQVALVERIQAKRTVENLAGLYISAVEKRYEDDLVKHEQKTQERLKEARASSEAIELEANWRTFRRDEARRWWDLQDDAQKDSLLKNFLDHDCSPTVRRSYQRGGMENRMFRVGFFDWVIQKWSPLETAEAKDFQAYRVFVLGDEASPASG